MCEPATIAAVATYFGAAAETAATIGAIGSAASVGLGALGAYQTARASKDAAINNARIADMQAADALKRGEQDRIEALRRGRLMEGQQRASLAARGLDLSEGTPNDILGQTDFFTQADAATLRTNARKEAWARQAQAGNYRAEAAATNPGLALTSTLLGGAGRVADRWYSTYGGGDVRPSRRREMDRGDYGGGL